MGWRIDGRLSALAKMEAEEWEPGDVPLTCPPEVAVDFMCQGRGSDMVELAVLQVDTYEADRDRDPTQTRIRLDPDNVEDLVLDYAPWLPIGSGW